MEAVILFPAIDLKNGEAVRLQQGDMARATVFHRDPAEQARLFAAQGFEYLHIVDLDGAFAGQPMNAGAVPALITTPSAVSPASSSIRGPEAASQTGSRCAPMASRPDTR